MQSTCTPLVLTNQVKSGIFQRGVKFAGYSCRRKGEIMSNVIRTVCYVHINYVSYCMPC